MTLSDAPPAGKAPPGDRKSWADGPLPYVILVGLSLLGQLSGLGGAINLWLIYLAAIRPARSLRFAAVTVLSYLAGIVIVFGVGYGGWERPYLDSGFTPDPRLPELHDELRARGAAGAVLARVPLEPKDTFRWSLAMGTLGVSPLVAIPLVAVPMAVLVFLLGGVFGIIGYVARRIPVDAPAEPAPTAPPRSRALRLLEKALLVWMGIVATIMGLILFFLPAVIIFFGLRAV